MKKLIGLLFVMCFTVTVFAETFIKILPFDPKKMEEIKVDGKILSIQLVESTVGKDHCYLVVTYTKDDDCIVPVTDTVVSDVKD